MTERIAVLPATLQTRPVAVPGERPPRPYHLVVDDPAGPVNVRWFHARAEPWRCATHGSQTSATCEHTFSAGLVLAEHLLGLTRVPDLNPEGTTTR